MILDRITNKYASQTNKNTLFHNKQHFAKTKINSQAINNHKNIYIPNQHIYSKNSAKLQFKTAKAFQNYQLNDQNNSKLANQDLPFSNDNKKCNQNFGKVNEQKILQLINAYPIQVQKSQIVNKMDEQLLSDQNSTCKVLAHKKIKIIKKQFQVKRQRQTLRLKKRKIQMLQKNKSQMENHASYQISAQSVSEQCFQFYNIYKDQQVFLKNDQYASMTVTHRLDNDIESDDDQVQRAVQKMTNFLTDSIRTAKFLSMMRKQHQALMNQEQSQ